MACREKKIFAGRKQASLSPVPPKETVATSEVSPNKQGTPTSDVSPTNDDEAAPKLLPMKATTIKVKTAAAKAATALAKKITKNVAKKAMKKSLSVNLKAKNKKTLKMKKQYAKALLTTGKNNFDLKKSALLKNGVKPKRIRKTKAQMQQERLLKEQLDDAPPVLEPILPLEEIIEKKGVKKRMKKAVLIDEAVKNIKTENSMMLIDETINSVIIQNTLEEEAKPARKRGRKSKQEVAETIEDVIKDLSNLIDGHEIKQEPSLSEVEKTETIKRRGYARKPKSELLKRKTIKKELIENNLEDNITIDASAQHLIDVLDLSVQKISQLSSPLCNRRHSIEKFPVSVFSSLPRTPRAKRVGRPRQSLDVSFGKRINPYSTRSDSQALRNGKHRKAKEALFDGLDNVSRKRKTLCSDFSGSEKSISKLGYESDCSFSDQVSSCGPDSLDQKDGPIKAEMIKTEIIESQNQTDTQDIVNIKSCSNSKAVNIKKRVPSLDSLSNNVEEDVKSEQNYTDNNSNLYDNSENFGPIKMETEDFSIVAVGNPSSKVPEKSIILDIMKQTFNDSSLEEQEKRATRSSATFKKPNPEESASKSSTVSTSKFYGIYEFAENEEASKSLENSPDETENGANIDEVQTLSDNHEEEREACVNGGECNSKSPIKMEVEETPEDFATKKDIMQALGLLTLEAAEEAKKNQILAAQEAKMRKEERKDKASTSDEGKKDKVFKSDYTGTLKTVIKLNRGDKRKGRNSLKLTLTKTKPKSTKENNDVDCGGTQDDHTSKYAKEVLATSWRTHAQVQSSDTAGALRKSHYSNRSNIMDGSSEDGDAVAVEGEDAGKSLVIPEKASSFSIHPGRVCKDECSNCNTKFGIFDTPQHIAQLKGVDRQNNILQNELKLTRDSCLCDACYRHVDRKANTPSYSSKGSKRNNLITPRQNYCHVLGCNKQASNILRRKVIIKMRKSICHTVNIDLDNPGLHSIPLCDDHYSLVEILMVCSMCKRRLAPNHIHYMGPETTELNKVLNDMNIPVSLNDSLAVCKCCKLFATLALRLPEERSRNDGCFFDQYKRRLLHFHKIELMNDAEAEEPISVPNKEAKEKFEKEQIIKKRKKFNQKFIENNDSLSGAEPQSDLSERNDQARVPSESNSTSKSRSESPSDYMVDYNMLTPSINMDCGSDAEANKRETVKPTTLKRAKSESVIKESSEHSKSAKISKVGGFNKTVQRLGTNPCLSVRQLFPGEEELGLQANIEYGNVKEKTPEGWEKCTSTIQYDADTKHLWNELQKPYGNQSSFLRHLILLEKYFRNGDLVLSPHASHHSINYSESVHNRLRAYDNIPTNPLPITLTVKKSNSGIITTKDAQPNNVPTINAANIPKNTPITISQINHLASNSKTRNPGVPPGLISIHPGPSRPNTSTRATPQQSQKIKFPITKNWKPNLIPIDPSKKDDKRPGYVRVVSNEKPYHITLDDYNRMCAIKKSYDLKRKRMMDAALAGSNAGPTSAILKTLGPRKGLTISTKTATITSPPSDNSYSESMDTESSLEKLDRTVENLESKFKESTTSLMNLPKIPKSLTVIPQTVAHKPTRPPSPNLMILPKPKSLTNKS